MPRIVHIHAFPMQNSQAPKQSSKFPAVPELNGSFPAGSVIQDESLSFNNEPGAQCLERLTPAVDVSA